MPTSSIYGVRVQSNLPIPLVASTTLTAGADLHISLGRMPAFLNDLRESAVRWRSGDRLDQTGNSSLVIWMLADGAWFHWRYSDGTEFLLDRSGTHLWATWTEPLTIEDTATYLLGPVMGFVLLLRGTHCLHASAIDVGDRAVAIVGPAGAGKSTTAAAFARLGYRVLADDVVTLAGERGEVIVHPAYPCVRLWSESAEALFGAAEAIPLLTPNWDKRYLDLGGGKHRYREDSLPLAAIYLLAQRSSAADAPRIEATPSQAAMIELVANSSVSYLKDKAARAAEFGVLSGVVETVPVRRAIPHSDLGHVDKLCEVILDDLRKRPRPHAPARAGARRERI